MAENGSMRGLAKVWSLLDQNAQKIRENASCSLFSFDGRIPYAGFQLQDRTKLVHQFFDFVQVFVKR